MKKVELNKLEGLNYEEGKKLLLNNGYVQNNSGRSDGVDCDYILRCLMKQMRKQMLNHLFRNLTKMTKF